MKLYKVKPNKLSVLKDWANFLTTNEETAKQLLQEENCSREFFYFFHLNGSDYVIAHMDGGPFTTPSSHEINIKHKEVPKECLEPESIQATALYDITA